MKDWFDALEAREQLFVGIGAFVVLLIVLWGLIWLPLDRGHDDMRASVDNWQRSLAELRVIGANVQSDNAAAGSARVNLNESPVVIVDRTLRERSLNNTVKRQQPTPNGIRVEFENVAFDQLVVWLGDLNAQYAMEVQAGSLSVASRAGPGRINASLTLERAP
ncbi:MAG: type II secretion system protein M [Gammaproteobacteria bacterium]|nr:type II secretion system protein M [Gammaproteobacteria bacterium]